MKMFKKGFTAVEVIIALVVVGGVAAVTIPLLSQCIQKSQIGSNVSRTVKSIEKSYTVFASGEDKTFSPDGLRFETKNVDVVSDYAIAGDATDNEKIIVQYTIDGNGKKKGPNVLGQDIYKFNLLSSGKVIPADEIATELVQNEYRVK